jgi:hypothetical protein
MANVRRTKYLFFWIDDAPFLDIPLLLRGKVALKPLKQMFAISLLQSREYPISLDELRILFTISADHWTPTSDVIEQLQVTAEILTGFERQGLLLTDENDDYLAELRRRDEQLASTQWNIYAAIYHFMSKWSDVNVNAHFPDNLQEWEESNARTDEVFRAFIDRNGRPPKAFHSILNPLSTVDLPILRRSDGLFATLVQQSVHSIYRRAIRF